MAGMATPQVNAREKFTTLSYIEAVAGESVGCDSGLNHAVAPSLFVVLGSRYLCRKHLYFPPK